MQKDHHAPACKILIGPIWADTLGHINFLSFSLVNADVPSCALVNTTFEIISSKLIVSPKIIDILPTDAG